MGAARLNLLLAVVLGALLAASLFIGPAGLSPSAVVAGAMGRAPESIVVQEIRVPRALLAALVGAGLGASGAAMQGLLRNPLAEPGTTGVASAASLGAVIALYYGVAAAFPLALPLFAFAGALAGAGLLLALAARAASTLTLILAGAAIGSFSTALVSLALSLAPNPYAIAEIVLWLLGSVKDRSLNDVALAAPFILTGIALTLLAGRGLDALTLGEEAAQSLGVAIGRLRALVVLGTSLAVGASVAVAGAIGFVGLVVPHVLRPALGHRPGALLLPSAFGGAILVLAADIAVRLLPTQGEIMLGVATALVGAPVFVHLLFRTRRTAP